jgi:membrane protease YdiL (CAAX protease family)
LLPWLVSPDFESVSPRMWTWPAVLLSSLAFGTLHQQWLAHALCNAGVAAAVLLGGRWELWA